MGDESRFVYMDHSATTPVDPRVVEAMLPYFTDHWGNPSSAYRHGARAAEGLAAARERVAELLDARPSEIVFTSCGTESDNLALRGVTLASRQRGAHIITTPIEHHAVGYTVEQLARYYGAEVTYLPVDAHGLVDPDDVARALTDRTVLVSVMYASNEVGTVEPIAEIGRLLRARNVPFHTDAVQAPGLLDLSVEALQVDLLSLSGHKFYGPKGVGVLYVRSGTPLLPSQTGGGQEKGRRAGTENVPYIVGLAKALELAESKREAEAARLRTLRDRLIQGLMAQVPDVRLTGHPDQRLPSHTSFLFRGIDGESILLRLDLLGVAASSGSACSSGAEGPSHVLTALGVDATDARCSLRLTLGRDTSEADVNYVLDVLPGVVAELRTMSPLYASH